MKNANAKLQNAQCTMQNAKYKMQNVKCKLQNAKYKMQNANNAKKIPDKNFPEQIFNQKIPPQKNPDIFFCSARSVLRCSRKMPAVGRHFF